MGLARSTYYDQPTRAVGDTALVEAMFRITDELRGRGQRFAGDQIAAGKVGHGQRVAVAPIGEHDSPL
jgi:hypothetical protein